MTRHEKESGECDCEGEAACACEGEGAYGGGDEGACDGESKRERAGGRRGEASVRVRGYLLVCV